MDVALGANQITLIVNCCLWFLLLVFAGYCLIQTYNPTEDSGWNSQRLFYLLTLLSAIARVLLFVVAVVYETRRAEVFQIWGLLWQTSPTILVFGAYTFLIIFFSELHTRTGRQGVGWMREILGTFNVLYAIGAIACFALIIRTGYTFPVFSVDYNSDYIYYLTVWGSIYICSDMVTIGGFIFYLWRLALYMGDFRSGTAKAKHIAARRVRIYTGICCICYLCRAGVILFEVVYENQYGVITSPQATRTIVVEIGVFVSELVALLVMMLWMRLRVDKGGVPVSVARVLSWDKQVTTNQLLVGQAISINSTV
eukprot:TRINITY_DN2147_c0_g2_i1.p1 TRINITY_DN2147_c0_g2~~TRINITY_DN2147_c0_g2_i1.p1  ORF type:complete len:311 (+),score=47.57 TRINITY_DN2147_c0_g2_i1:47-979(+)